MSSCGRGRGYLGRLHSRDDTPRPGDAPTGPQRPYSPPAQLVPHATRLTIGIDNMQVNGRPLDSAEARVAPTALPTSAPTQTRDKEPSRETDDEKALAELLLIEDKYRPIVTLLEQFTTGEDGIVFNRKLKDFEAALGSICQDDTQLLAAFSSLRGAALRDAGTARKLASVGASFTRQQRQNVFRAALLNIMQSTFAKLDVLERSNPQILTNAATLMGDYFTEARLCNGSKVNLLCPPLMQYLRSLLNSNDRRAHRALATQLMQNGRELLTTNSQDLDDLSIAVRRKILTCQPNSTIWLMLSADLCISKFLPLPSTLQSFYANNLDLLDAAGEQSKGYSEVAYGSWKKEDDARSDVENERDRLERESAQQLTIPNEDGSTRKLRPILGAGVRLNSSLSDSSQSSPYPSVATQEAGEPRGASQKSSLAKRYDLNTWRQPENDEKTDSLDDVNASFSSDKFIPSQQFADGYRDYEGYQDGKPQYPPKYYAPNESFSNPPPFVPPPDGKFTTPPPFVPDRSAPVPYGAQEKSPHLSDVKYGTPPIERSSRQSTSQENPLNRAIAQSSLSEDVFVDKTKINLQEHFNQLPHRASEFDGANQQRNVHQDQSGNETAVLPQQERDHPPFSPKDRVNPPFNPQSSPQFVQPGTVSPPDQQRSASEKNFQSGDRPRRPPENWRKERPKEEQSRRWGRQKSKECEEADGEAKTEESAKLGAQDTKFRRRESRSRRKSEDVEDAGAKNPQRRHVMDVPRGKYWGHDDRLDKDYNS